MSPQLALPAPPELAPWPEDCVGSTPRRLSPAEILQVLRDLGRDSETYRALARHTRGERWFRRLSVTDCYDVWLLGWHSYQGVDLHDHGGSAGGFLVLEGELLETSMGRERTGGLSERRVSVGTAAAFGPGHVHWVANGTSRLATSLHVYSPPLSTMGFFDYSAPGELVRSHTEAALASRPDGGGL